MLAFCAVRHSVESRPDLAAWVTGILQKHVRNLNDAELASIILDLEEPERVNTELWNSKDHNELWFGLLSILNTEQFRREQEAA